jgi:signal transduction histidine kinase
MTAPESNAGVAAAARLPSAAEPQQGMGWALLESACRLAGADAGALQWLAGPQEQDCLLRWRSGDFSIPRGWGSRPRQAGQDGWLCAEADLAGSRHVLDGWQRGAGASHSHPVGSDGQVFAVIHLLRSAPAGAEAQPEDGSLADLTRLAALQIESELNRVRLCRENQALRALARVAVLLDPLSAESAITGQALELAMQIGGFSRGAILLRQDGGALHLSVSQGLDPMETQALLACPLDPRRSPQLALLGAFGSLSPEQLQAHPGLGPAFPSSYKRFRCQPLNDGAGLLGLILLADEAPVAGFDEGLFDAFGPVLGGQAARAVETARLVNELADSKRRLEQATESLLHAERLAAIGRLAAGVAHQIRNPLTTISATTELMMERLGPEHALVPELERLAQKVSDTEAIVRDLMQLGRPLPVHLQRCGIQERLVNVGQFLRPKAEGQGVDLRMEPPASAETAWMDPAQLESCLLDLGLAALQGLGSGGRIELGAAVSGASLQVWVTDNGKGLSGVPPETVFEPFVSRRLGGTGLRLYYVQRLCQAMGAAVQAEELPQAKGTRMSIFLDRGEAAPAALRA